MCSWARPMSICSWARPMSIGSWANAHEHRFMGQAHEHQLRGQAHEHWLRPTTMVDNRLKLCPRNRQHSEATGTPKAYHSVHVSVSDWKHFSSQ